jgi:hypothetical protein
MTSRVVIPVLSGLEQNKRPLVKQVVKGIKQIQEQEIASQTNTLNQTSFNWQPPSQSTVIDKCFILEHEVILTATSSFIFPTLAGSVGSTTPSTGATAPVPAANTATIGLSNQVYRFANVPVPTVGQYYAAVNATTTGQEIRLGNNLAPRQFPLANAMDSIDLVINGTHFSVSVNQYLQAVMKYTTPEWRQRNLSETMHAPDSAANYVNNCGTSKSPLNVSSAGFYKNESPRGSIYDSIYQGGAEGYGLGAGSGVSVTITSANVLTFKFREPLFISPLMSMLGHGLTNVNQLDVTIRWNSNLSAKMFSLFDLAVLNYQPANRVTQNTITGVTFGNQSSSKLRMRYYTPQDDVEIPNEIVLPYKQPQINSQVLSDVASVTGNNVRLNQVPESVYLFVRRSNGYSEANHADMALGDVYARITNVNLNWKNQSGILSGFSEADLRQLAINNGYDACFHEIDQIGMVLKLNFGEDIPLDDNESPGTRGDYNWQVSLNLNASGVVDAAGTAVTAANLTFNQIFILNGHAIVSPNECRVSTGVLSLEDSMNASDMGHVYNAGVDGGSMVGGSMVGGSEVGGSLIGGVVGHLKKAYNIGSHLGKAGAAAMPELRKAVDAYQSRA